MGTKYITTGNKYLSLPTIVEENGFIESINCLYFKYNGLVEILPSKNNFLIKPFITINNHEIYLDDLKWHFDVYWIPHWEYNSKYYTIKGCILAPPDSKACVYSYEIINKGKKDLNVVLGFKGNISGLLRTINYPERMNVLKKVFLDKWGSNKMVVNFINEATILSFSIMGESNLDYLGWNKNIDYRLDDETIYADNFEAINYCLYKEVTVPPEETVLYKYYISSGIDPVGSFRASIHLNRIDYKNLYNDTADFLKKRIKDIKDIQLNKVMNKNLLFNYFYSAGKTIDTEELVCVTSRSPLYYVSAAYWDRDTFYWSFPGLLLSDVNMAREVLEYFFKYQIKNVGTHSRYINGTVLEPGFELDELCAPIIGIDYYLNFTKDYEFIKQEYILNSIEKIIKLIMTKKNKNTFLFETFLLPTDDFRKFPYVTYDNVLVWKVFNIMRHICDNLGYYSNAEKFKEYSIKVKESIYANMIIEDEGKKCFAWSTDLKGHYRFYDEAAGSLVLLDYYGFCDKSNDIYINTLRELYNDDNKFYVQDGEFKELANLHTPELTPWILSAINSALSIRKNEVKDIFRNAPMDNGLACESIYSDTGEVASGRHFATCAGFLGYAIWYAYK